MSKETNLQKLESIIREAIPELMELELGCELKYLPEYGKIEIIGKPITLVNVLNWVDLNFGMWNYGKIGGMTNAEKLLRLWNLDSNLLQDQSEELIEFLMKLAESQK